MPLPNFFVIGAPKSGTTALHRCLCQHPDIFMSEVKEPLYFALDGKPPEFRGPMNAYLTRMARWRPKDYFELFAEAKEGQAIGEASVMYLRSEEAARHIRQQLPDSRLVAVLRQPAKRAYSHYMFLKQQGVEDAPTFAEALSREETRVKAGWFSTFFYRSIGYYHRQLSAWFALFPREQIRVYLYEDWKDTPLAMLRDLFQFLGADPGFVPEVGRHNVTRLPRSRRLHRWVTGSGREDKLVRFLPSAAERTLKSALRPLNDRFNLRLPPPPDPAFMEGLTEEYRQDILGLQTLLGRDLSHWLPQ